MRRNRIDSCRLKLAGPHPPQPHENIKQAIEEYLAVVDGELKGATIREVEVAA